MKKSIFIVAALAAFSFASCKKDYTCVCRDGSTEYQRYTIRTTKSKSKDVCAEQEANWNTAYPGVSCSIE
ncbi:MAG: hypothetical protein M3R27_00545 [Bacteroidota bacterium]|nr:hypothetical protein [Bacteroidota bacterium]